MSHLLKAIIALTILMLGPLAQAETPTVDRRRALAIVGPIGNGNILQLVQPMMKLASDGTGKDIDLIISSPGGDTGTGFVFINAMEAVKAKGTTIRCFVPTLAASMAFQIFLHCDERYALNYSFLLWHRVRVLVNQTTALTAVTSRELEEDLARLDALILSELLENLDLSERVVRHHFERETLHVAVQLAALDPDFMTALPAVPGLIEAVLDPKTPGIMNTGNADMKPGSIIYIAPMPIWNETP